MKFAIHPLPGFGARIDHDLATSAGTDLASDLRAALHRYRFLIIPRQHLNHADLLTTSELFGAVETDVDRRYAVAGFPGITVVSNVFEDGRRVGIYDGDHEEEWHADNSFKPQLTTATLLYSVITARVGGETRFADATRAYADLPADLKSQVDGLRAIHSIQQLSVRQTQAAGRSSAANGTLAHRAEVQHPLAPVHPRTGLPSLLLGSMVVKGVRGVSAQASEQLLGKLLKHVTSGPYVYSHRWSQGDLVVWDNRAVLHSASPCDSACNPRLLFRATVR